MVKAKIDLVFEISWEVCNKVGGIYTVLSSKAFQLHELLGDEIIFIGPDFHDYQNPLFVEDNSVLPGVDSAICKEVPFRKGRWDVPGSPAVLLIDFGGIYENLNAIFAEMWSNFKVDSLRAYGDYQEACAFAVSAAMVIGAVYRHCNKCYKNTIAHFNEWTTGMGLLYLKLHFPKIATVFTTHATSIGRSICGNNKPLYGYLKNYYGDQMADELNMQSKHSLEKASAQEADCFTAVSDITATESEQLLEIRPHIVTPNGFEKNIAGSPSQQKKHRESGRKRILETISALTGKNYSKDTFIIGTSGRNEYRNKGLDVFLDVLYALREKHTGDQIVALIMVPAWVHSPRVDLQQNIIQKQYNHIENPYITHNLNFPENDAILSRIRQLNLVNSDSDKIDVVYIPCYLNGKDGIIDLDYYSVLPALDLSIFPSYYEPWGYTPLESIAYGVPTITTSLSGFGQWIKSTFPDKNMHQTGVGVVTRDDFNYHEVVSQIVKLIIDYEHSGESAVAETRQNALKTASCAEWENFIKYYMKAYSIALCNRNKRLKKLKVK